MKNKTFLYTMPSARGPSLRYFKSNGISGRPFSPYTCTFA